MFENFTFAPSTTTATMTTARGPEDTHSKNPHANTYTSSSTATTPSPANDALSSLRGLTLNDDDNDDVRCKRQSFARMQTDEAVLRAVRDLAARMGEGNTATRKLSAGGVVKRRRSPGRKGTTLAV